MRLLLDTHAFLWAAASPERLGRYVDLVADPATVRLLSAASSWEIAIKYRLGKLVLPEAPANYVPDAMRRLAVQPLPIEHIDALAVGELPTHHRDPFDRMIVVQAQRLSVPLLTADPAIARYDVDRLVP